MSESKRSAMAMMADVMLDDDTISAELGSRSLLPSKKRSRKSDLQPVENDAQHARFVSQLASLNTDHRSRFLHATDSRQLDSVPLSELLGGDDPLAGPAVKVEHLLSNLPENKANKKLKSDVLLTVNKTARNKAQTTDVDTVDARTRTEVLDNPLEAGERGKVIRSAAYEQVKEDVSVWDAVVHSRRQSDHVSFPLAASRDEGLKTVVKTDCEWNQFTPATALEHQVMSLLRPHSTEVESEYTLNANEESVLARMSMRQAIERKKELKRLKVLQMQHEAKMRRQNKIKSRRYRKIIRKRREADDERHQAENPDEANDKMDRRRVEERASLRHRNTSRFMRLQARRAKNSDESRERVQSQLVEHRRRIEKMAESNTANEVAKAEMSHLASAVNVKDDPANPWLNFNSETVSDEVRIRLQAASRDMDTLFAEADAILDWPSRASDSHIDMENANSQIDANAKESRKKRKRRQMASNKSDVCVPGQIKSDSQLDSAVTVNKGTLSDKNEPELEREKPRAGRKRQRSANKQDQAKNATDRSSALNANKDCQTAVPSLVDKMPRDLESTSITTKSDHQRMRQQKLVAEAFAGDDVVTEFKSAKEAAVAADQPAVIDTFLRGWGSWAGPGVDESMSKKRRSKFLIRPAAKVVRKDKKKPNLILNDHLDKRIESHQVRTVPFPFSSVSDVEANMRMPLGETFVPRTAFNRLTRPACSVKVGEAIDPMDRYQLVKRGVIASQ